MLNFYQSEETTGKYDIMIDQEIPDDKNSSKQTKGRQFGISQFWKMLDLALEFNVNNKNKINCAILLLTME